MNKTIEESSQSGDRNNSRLSSNASSKIENYCSMSRRRKSQGLDGSAKKDQSASKQIFKPHHLPQITKGIREEAVMPKGVGHARDLKRNASNTKNLDNAAGPEHAQNPVRIRMIRQKRATCPGSLNLDDNQNILDKNGEANPIVEGSHEWVTPTKKGEPEREHEEEELVNEDSDADKQSEESIKQSSSDEDSEEDDEAMQAQL